MASTIIVEQTSGSNIVVGPVIDTGAFTDLTDVDGNYVGNAGKIVLVKGTEDGLTFGSASGTGDMNTAVYDTNSNGTVDDAELVNGLTVETAVPSGAVFTDTQVDVQAGTNITIDKTNPLAPIISSTGGGGGGGQVDTVSSSNLEALTVDATDPINPILNILTKSPVTSVNKIATEVDVVPTDVDGGGALGGGSNFNFDGGGA